MDASASDDTTSSVAPAAGATDDAGPHDAVAHLVAPLSGLDHLPVEEHVAVFADVHAALRDRLSAAASPQH